MNLKEIRKGYIEQSGSDCHDEGGVVADIEKYDELIGKNNELKIMIEKAD